MEKETMVRYIKVLSKDKRVPVLYISSEKWKSIIDYDSILVLYMPDGKKEPHEAITINKMEVIYAEYDEEYTKKANVAIHDLYHHIPSNTVVKFKRGTLPPAEFANDYKRINNK